MLEFRIVPYIDNNRPYYRYRILFRKVHLFQIFFRWEYRTNADGYIREFDDFLYCALEMNHIKAEFENKQLTK